MSAEEFAAIVDDGKFIGRRVRDLLAVAQGVDDIITKAGAAGGWRVGVPDELAVVLARGHQHRQLSYARVEGSVRAEVEGQAKGALGDLRGVEHHGTGAGGGYLAAVGDERIKGGLFVFGDGISGYGGSPGHDVLQCM